MDHRAAHGPDQAFMTRFRRPGAEVAHRHLAKNRSADSSGSYAAQNPNSSARVPAMPKKKPAWWTPAGWGGKRTARHLSPGGAWPGT